jgi:hypothetical protein
MNISETEAPVRFVAKTCVCADRNENKVTYEFVDTYHSLCLDKKDIIYAELDASNTLLKDVSDGDKKTIESEIADFRRFGDGGRKSH